MTLVLHYLRLKRHLMMSTSLEKDQWCNFLHWLSKKKTATTDFNLVIMTLWTSIVSMVLIILLLHLLRHLHYHVLLLNLFAVNSSLTFPSLFLLLLKKKRNKKSASSFLYITFITIMYILCSFFFILSFFHYASLYSSLSLSHTHSKKNWGFVLHLQLFRSIFITSK